jgi:hypothetical protein
MKKMILTLSLMAFISIEQWQNNEAVSELHPKIAPLG